MAVLKGPDGLEQFADKCCEALFVPNPIEFKYPQGSSLKTWSVEEIRSLNKPVLDGLNGNANVYAIYTSNVGEQDQWAPVYVGQRKSTSLRERLVQHLITKSEHTGSVLEAVKTSVSDGHRIAISYIKVEPESLRLYVEETIISQRKAMLPWNTHG
ncbi:hypothetical protein OM427_24935 [Halomonas sp. 18H]|nr:hypothetical protein [Halomonas sp. 18H]MCW4152764.1 hypothetical protein [Halomonas sp. 18H]